MPDNEVFPKGPSSSVWSSTDTNHRRRREVFLREPQVAFGVSMEGLGCASALLLR